MSVPPQLCDTDHVDPQRFTNAFHYIIAHMSQRRIDEFLRIGLVHVHSQCRLMDKRLLMAVENRFASQLKSTIRPQFNALDGRLTGGAQDTFCFFGGIGALRQLRLFRSKFHRERQARIGTAFLAVGFRQQFLNL